MGYTARFVTGSYQYFTPYLSQRHSKWPLLMGSCLLPLKTRITGLSQSDSASWRAVRESQVPVKPILQHLSGDLSEWLTIYPVFNSKIWVWSVVKRSTGSATGSCRSDRDTISTTFCCLPPKDRAIKALTKTNRGQNGLASRSVLWPYNVMIFRFVPFSPLNSRAYIPCWKPSQQEWFLNKI